MCTTTPPPSRIMRRLTILFPSEFLEEHAEEELSNQSEAKLFYTPTRHHHMKLHLANAIPDPLVPFAEKQYDRTMKLIGVREKLSALDSSLAAEFFESHDEFEKYRNEISHSPVSRWLSDASSRLGEEFGNWDTCIRYYCLMRKLEPDTVIETGVRHGQSTLFILAALQMNKHGSLISIDYPLREDEASDELIHRNPNCVIPAGKDPGWIIPEQLTKRWKLFEGPSQQHLVDVLSNMEDIDVFIHDSEHSVNCMLFEYEAAWPRIGHTGVLISDDINSNNAWQTFVASKSIRQLGKITNNVGYAVKER